MHTKAGLSKASIQNRGSQPHESTTSGEAAQITSSMRTDQPNISPHCSDM